eukprot:COSAG05_NODE_217_length_13794_cov_5.734064_12_plen_183_part_00
MRQSLIGLQRSLKRWVERCQELQRILRPRFSFTSVWWPARWQAGLRRIGCARREKGAGTTTTTLGQQQHMYCCREEPHMLMLELSCSSSREAFDGVPANILQLKLYYTQRTNQQQVSAFRLCRSRVASAARARARRAHACCRARRAPSCRAQLPRPMAYAIHSDPPWKTSQDSRRNSVRLEW